jgi:hypothetical protein
MMPKGDTISAIRRLNPTAQPAFLAEFSIDDLQRYLDRLTEPRNARATSFSGHRPLDVPDGFAIADRADGAIA